MRRFILPAAAALALLPATACTTSGDPWNDGYYDRYYRAGAYEPYALGRNDTLYRGADGRYYCRRRDGTVGLVIGAGVGALLGNLIAPRGSKTIGTIIGGAGGAAIGYAIDRGDVQCR